jgi:hypothetical protein
MFESSASTWRRPEGELVKVVFLIIDGQGLLEIIALKGFQAPK